jgi:hypothetical protein
MIRFGPWRVGPGEGQHGRGKEQHAGRDRAANELLKRSQGRRVQAGSALGEERMDLPELSEDANTTTRAQDRLRVDHDLAVRAHDRDDRHTSPP